MIMKADTPAMIKSICFPSAPCSQLIRYLNFLLGKITLFILAWGNERVNVF
jgi:hypothetical protein